MFPALYHDDLYFIIFLCESLAIHVFVTLM